MDKLTQDILVTLLRDQQALSELVAGMATVAEKLGLTQASVTELVGLCQNQAHSERLLSVEGSNSSLAAQIDTRSEHPPQLSDDENYFDIDREKPAEE
jgi:hypothetical protein